MQAQQQGPLLHALAVVGTARPPDSASEAEALFTPRPSTTAFSMRACNQSSENG